MHASLILKFFFEFVEEFLVHFSERWQDIKILHIPPSIRTQVALHIITDKNILQIDTNAFCIIRQIYLQDIKILQIPSSISTQVASPALALHIITR